MNLARTSALPFFERLPALSDPWEAALAFGPGTVMAVLSATSGPASRSPGAAMAIAASGRFAGALTSGCIEADLILQARKVRESGAPLHLRYGEGSAFMDLKLPCGGAIEVQLFMIRDVAPLTALSAARADRRDVTLTLLADGQLQLSDKVEAPSTGFAMHFGPGLRFLIFGAGAEAMVFADLVRTLGYDHRLISHDAQSLALGRQSGCDVLALTLGFEIQELVSDSRCAAVLFYHDHDYETEILRQLMEGPAFYIGAQGSRATHAKRLARLEDLGIDERQLARVQGPIGLIPSARDPKILAISALAEVLMQAEALGP
ncbi:XdhC family protein [Xinfangfangia sp. CPCC 101601]|uniref:XdhC family protein n=1 Tax=Pseudogemmobacter lacusdianii TaxID=3069608 RepID=A0ABU0W1K3_9RHOB|nr:XdhC family protein [Xinfangfangia sp. CPCC 101601]MDQ2067897.1 XdhC family protein [Xinfangfangia sp. CPCC 101601]